MEVRKHFNDEWLRYLHGVYADHSELPQEQTKQLCMAFYAGALACFSALAVVANERSTSPDTKRHMAEKLRKEIIQGCEDFINSAEKTN